MLLKRGANSVELADNLEELAQCGLPGVAVIVLTDTVDQRQARTPGPAQNGHFRLVLGTVGHRAIHHIDDPGTFHDRCQQFTFIDKPVIAPVLEHKSPHGFRVIRGGNAVGFQPL